MTRGLAAGPARSAANARAGTRRTLAAVAVALLPLAPLSAHAQQLSTAAGRVIVPRASDTVPLPRARVLLHRVGADAQGPIDSMTADGAGRFRFRFRADTSALYLLSTRYGGIEYFSPPVHTNPARPDTAIALAAYDTSSTTPIAVEARHIVVPRAGGDGSRPVLDLIVLRNDGIRARVAPDSAHPSWSLTLPAGSGEMQLGESDLSPDAVIRVGDTVRVLAPLAPGQKQLSIQYATVPVRGRLVFPIGATETPVNLLVEEPGVRVSGGTLALADTQVIEGRSFRRFSGRVPGGGSITLTVPAGPAVASRRILAGLVGGLALALGAAAVWLVRRPRRPRAPVAPGSPDETSRLLDAIAALDARYAGREGETPPDEWKRYTEERAALKARLEHALAGPGPGPYV
ncbi:MAG TPA: hypothetical protein VJQ46_00720 [Gemmatimonadales bacterium]|nr:hypothetical protein [Gemmatimonadales bacterium]